MIRDSVEAMFLNYLEKSNKVLAMKITNYLKIKFI